MEHTTSTNLDAKVTRGVLDRVRESATSQLSTQKDRATDSLGSLAQAVRHSTQSLRDNQQDTVARYIEQAADHIERFSTQLRERNVAELMREVQQFARRRPAVFIGAAFVVGLASARFLKSSGTTRAYAGQHDLEADRYGSSASRYGQSPSEFGRTDEVGPRYAGGGL